MSETKIIHELFKEPQETFQKHLEIIKNERMIFSGKFGMGKTTFLKHFFNEGNQLAKYNVIHLFPVNYSVATNEDIFRLIKYDVIYEMLRLKIEIESYDVKFIDSLPGFLKKNIDKVAAALVYMIPVVGKDVVESYERLKGLIDDFLTKHKEYSNEINDGDQLISYLESIEIKEGGIFENDIITKLIENVLSKIKNGDKENILVIDDLDRLDPEHIFRILNVFAAHFDRKLDTKNKFGFDKVIFVCDIENVRNIFKAKYGDNVDFSGYIDKFYSNHIYSFNNFQEYLKVVRSLYNVSIKRNDVNSDNVDGFIYRHQTIGFFTELMNCLSDYQQIDLRNVLKWRTKNFTHKGFYLTSEFSVVEVRKFPFVLLILFLSEIKGDVNSLIESIKNIHSKFQINNENVNNVCEEMLELLYKDFDFANETASVKEINGTKRRIVLSKSSRDVNFKAVTTLSGEQYFFDGNDSLSLIIDTILLLKRHQII